MTAFTAFKHNPIKQTAQHMMPDNILQYPVQKNPKPKVEYKLQLVSKVSPLRKQVEDFIQLSYYNHFSAQLDSFFPLILAVIQISDNSLVGALGLRYADEQQLFSESYLSESIEDIIFSQVNAVNKPIARNRIIELGNFVVRKTTDIKTVIPFISKFIKSLDAQWAVYTLIRPIKSHFKKLGIELNFINEADISAVNGAASHWGNYYNFKPAVYYSSIKDNMNDDNSCP